VEKAILQIVDLNGNVEIFEYLVIIREEIESIKMRRGNRTSASAT
jgi:hypothetical protein